MKRGYSPLTGPVALPGLVPLPMSHPGLDHRTGFLVTGWQAGHRSCGLKKLKNGLRRSTSVQSSDITCRIV